MNQEPAVLEENLIREAVSRIREWLRGKAREGKTSPPPRLAVKFCGGCNPVIERMFVAQRIREELAGEASWVEEPEEADFLLMVNGCRTACADVPETRSGRPVAVVAGESISS